MSTSQRTGFPRVLRVGDMIYVGASTSPSEGSIETQTSQAFEELISRLRDAGALMSDLVNLRTYYVYVGAEGRDVTDYWEKMTAVRLRYIADPGPAATAVRVLGVPHARSLIGADGIATINSDRQRIMPAHAWDWSIPVPLSQGWRIGNKILAGGQISADTQGKTLAEGDPTRQTANALEYLRHVLLDGGHSLSNLVSLRICFKHTGNAEAAATLIDTIQRAVRELIPEPRPAVTFLGVNLLYEGLLLEIDAVSMLETKRASAALEHPNSVAGFPLACAAGDELFIGGLSAVRDTLEAQVSATLVLMGQVLVAEGFSPSDLVKLTLFTVVDGQTEQAKAARDLIVKELNERFPTAQPVLTFLSLPGLARRELRFQLDGLAVREANRATF